MTIANYLIRFIVRFVVYWIWVSLALGVMQAIANKSIYKKHVKNKAKKSKVFSEASKLFKVSKRKLKKMSKNEITKLYRKRVKEVHPDHGGKKEDFIKLKNAYDFIMAC